MLDDIERDLGTRGKKTGHLDTKEPIRGEVRTSMRKDMSRLEAREFMDHVLSPRSLVWFLTVSSSQWNQTIERPRDTRPFYHRR